MGARFGGRPFCYNCASAMRELWMVVRSSTDEFERDGVKAVRENVKSGHYGEPKKQQALM